MQYVFGFFVQYIVCSVCVVRYTLLYSVLYNAGVKYRVSSCMQHRIAEGRCAVHGVRYGYFCHDTRLQL